MEMSEYVLPFEQCDITMVNRVGGKCASLGELLRAQIPVPPGYALTTRAYERFLEENGIQNAAIDRLKGLDYSDVDEIDKASRDIRTWIEGGKFSEELEDIIAENYRVLSRRTRMPALPVAVRSSATAEDLPDASFAGQQDTYLWVRGIDDVLHKVRKCWSSLFTARAISYRLKMGFDHSKVLISVAIQKMVRSFTAGVMFTLNPSTGDRATVVIDSNWGFGESVVSGEVTPDQFQVNKITMDIVKRTVSDKAIYYTTDPETDEVKKLEVDAERRQQQTLLDTEIINLVDLAKRIEKHYGKPMDIEWATEKFLPFKGEVFILQSRPETVWSQKEVKPLVQPRKSALEHIVAGLLSGKKVT
ncbi:PEP/pyruvate-binding domain-containing protein [Desulfomonile tiedjei]|uniref:Phosphoenolpyruvate synthase n=1 Tax=Desulfomonile tiedjei (strain ATCC 49306 / DSM 6799 / DCB-1) TaxID=706587 RepID=I4C1W3_DESTA|nr:PEP/pyruvate-binding domain-containing protein [Desulfomonile tiedjei]AFM23554.1 phosphoenolpyruvate synthase/pyruvate phosphate dikinase [Desulfomonile tiedjei DSM 6799]